LQPGFSLGKDKVIKNQERSASRLQVLGARKKEVNVAVSSTGTTLLPTPSQNQVRRKTEDEIHQKEITQDPIDERKAVPLRDSSLFYKNGNPKPPPTGRLLIRVLTSGKGKRSGGRKKGGRRDRSRGIPAEGPKEPSPETAERTNKEDDPIQTLKVDRDKMIHFSFIKHAVLGEMNKETQNKPTHNMNQHIGDAGPEPPTQHKGTTSREHPAEPETEIGAACFEPGTALLLQDPLNQDTYDPDQALSRPIGSLKYRDTLLAERHGSNGWGTFSYLSKVTCVMLFEIPQDDDQLLIKSSKKTLIGGTGGHIY